MVVFEGSLLELAVDGKRDDVREENEKERCVQGVMYLSRSKRELS